MIKRTHDAIMKYSAVVADAGTAYKAAMKNIKSTYKETSPEYAKGIKSAKDTLKTAIKPAMDEYRKMVEDDFVSAKAAIYSKVSATPSADLLPVLELIRSGKLSEMEIAAIINAHSGNYLDSKMIADAAGTTFETADHVLECLDLLKTQIDNFFNSYNEKNVSDMQYVVRLMQNGTWIADIDQLTDNFVNLYSDSEVGHGAEGDAE